MRSQEAGAVLRSSKDKDTEASEQVSIEDLEGEGQGDRDTGSMCPGESRYQESKSPDSTAMSCPLLHCPCQDCGISILSPSPIPWATTTGSFMPNDEKGHFLQTSGEACPPKALREDDRGFLSSGLRPGLVLQRMFYLDKDIVPVSLLLLHVTVSKGPAWKVAVTQAQ